ARYGHARGISSAKGLLAMRQVFRPLPRETSPGFPATLSSSCRFHLEESSRGKTQCFPSCETNGPARLFPHSSRHESEILSSSGGAISTRNPIPYLFG